MYNNLIQLQKALLKKLENMEGKSKEKSDLLIEAKDIDKKIEDIKNKMENIKNDKVSIIEKKKELLDKELEDFSIKNEGGDKDSKIIIESDNKEIQNKINENKEESKNIKTKFSYSYIPKKRVFSIDNRPTTIKIFNLPEVLRNEENLKKHFNLFGLIKSFTLNLDLNNCIISYSNRKMAEKAISFGKNYGENKLIMEFVSVIF
jgi:hypothetical protein